MTTRCTVKITNAAGHSLYLYRLDGDDVTHTGALAAGSEVGGCFWLHGVSSYSCIVPSGMIVPTSDLASESRLSVT